MLDDFLAWWLAQWRDILPRRWRDPGGDRNPVVIAEPDLFASPARIAIAIRQFGRQRRLGDISVGGGPGSGGNASRNLPGLLDGIRPHAIALALPPGTLLDREVALPLAAERDLGRVLHYEMDRLTPFNADDLLYSFEIARRDRVGGRLHLRLALVPKLLVEAALDALARAGIAPDAIESTGLDGARQRIVLGRKTGGGATRDRVTIRAAWALVAGLAIACLVVPFLRQNSAIAAADHRIAALRGNVAVANAMRTRIAGATAGSDVLAGAEREIGNPLETLAGLTDALPDDTFLTDLSLTGRKLTINGQSASAAKLIGALSANPRLRNPSFVAPVTRLEASHTDLFSIKADLAPPGSPALPGSNGP